jgi:hypothetical protein
VRAIQTGNHTVENVLHYEGWRVAGAGVFAASLVFFSFALLLKLLSEEFAWTRVSAA